MSLYVAPADHRLTDAIAAGGWLDDFEANQAMGYGLGNEGAQRAYEELREALQARPQILFGVYRSDDGSPIAFTTLQKIGPGLARFHGLVAPEYRGTIWAARAIQAIEAAAFSNGTERLETEVLTQNRRAVRLLKGLGFIPEGIHKGRHEMDGKRHNTITLRMMKKEWRH